MSKVYSYDIYKNRTNNSLLQFFKDFLKYNDEYDLEDYNKKLDFTSDFISIVNNFKDSIIAVVGDYDVDGITSTAIMVKGLEKYGVKKVYHFIPNRFIDGYGINTRMVDECIKKNVSLIITVDNGIKAFEAIDYAVSNNITVIDTDHHTPDAILPNAMININPHLANDNLKTKDICGAMVAYLLIKELLQDSNLKEFKVLAAIGTICDVMPLVYENRRIVKELIDIVKKDLTTYNHGLTKLLLKLKIDLFNFNIENVSFTLGPLLNSAGRLDSADLALDLLLEKDENRINQIITKLLELNDKRKELTNSIKTKAKEKMNDYDISNILYVSDAHEGLIGVCAGSICEDTDKPTFVFTNSNGLIKGSGRGPDWCDLVEICSSLFEKVKPMAFGGHKKAMGVTFKNLDDLKIFKEEFDKIIGNINHKPKEEIYLRFPNGYSVEEVKDTLDILSPFGEGLKEPTFTYKGVITNISPLGRGHTKFFININNTNILGLYFFHVLDESYKNKVCDIVFNIKKEYSNFYHRLEYKLFIKEIK